MSNMSSVNQSVRFVVDMMKKMNNDSKHKNRRQSCLPERSMSGLPGRRLSCVTDISGKRRSSDEISENVRRMSLGWKTKARCQARSRAEEKSGHSKGFLRFRRVAKAIKMILQVCRICREMQADLLANEAWYHTIDVYSQESSSLTQQNNRRGRPFVTFVPDEDNKSLVQLTFNKSEFSREYRADFLLTDEIRTLLQQTGQKSRQRTTEQENEFRDKRTIPTTMELGLIRFLKRISTDFNGYPLDVQRRIVKCMAYDKYRSNRCITRAGLLADGVYFVLSGTLAEKGEKKVLKELKPGDKFGDDDLICGCPRRATVVTRSAVELVIIHRLDYRAIFTMADDTNNPRFLDVCKQDLVFQHFPMKILIENPGVWTVLSYKFGRLIVRDSNDTEWIYIIKSGDARVLKHLEPGLVDMHTRRQLIQERLQKEDPYHKTTTMIDFVSKRREKSSVYRHGNYHPVTEFRYLKSAPPGRQMNLDSRSGRSLPFLSLPNTPFLRGKSCRSERRLLQSRPDADGTVTPELINEVRVLGKDQTRVGSASSQRDLLSPQRPSSKQVQLPEIRTVHISEEADQEYNRETVETLEQKSGIQESHLDETCTKADNIEETSVIGKRSLFLETGLSERSSYPCRRPGTRTKKKKPQTKSIPPFVQLESLHSGKVFGLRSCLPREERGPSASLVSGGCEVVQINKKFFMKNADESVYSLIRAKYKRFLSQDELLDSLARNLEWEEYKQTTVGNFFAHLGRPATCYPETLVL